MNKKIEHIMSLSVENLAQEQHKALKQHVLDTLNRAVKLIEKEEYDEIEKMTFHSSSGDGWGTENDCINFNYGEGDTDILEVVNTLTYLKQTSTSGE